MNRQERLTIAGVGLSSPDKVLFQEQGVTKADLARHYERVASRMLPHVENRLISLVRCPDGAGGQCFFQRHGSKGFPDAVKRKEIVEKNGGKDDYLYVDGLPGIIAAVQMAAVEFHIWGSRIDHLEQPDRIVFDLDPDDGLGFARVRQAAFAVREGLSKLGLNSLAMVTGGKGIHVIVPLQRSFEWPAVKVFARAFAERMAGDSPDQFLVQASKAKREGRIFIDWLRNERSATAIAPYSTRAKKDAPIATPVSWDELKQIDAANSFHIDDMAGRMKKDDPWADSAKWRQSITRAMLNGVGAE